MRKTVTLTELILGVVLLGMVILGVGAFNAASHQLLASSERKTQVINELTFILDQLHRDILLGIGDVNNPSINVNAAGNTLTIRQDIDLATGNPLNTPGDYTDDAMITYVFGVANPNQITANGQVLTSRFIAGPNFAVSIVNGGVQLADINIRFDPNNPAIDPLENPQVSMTDAVAAQTLFFYPLSQSWS